MLVTPHIWNRATKTALNYVVFYKPYTEITQLLSIPILFKIVNSKISVASVVYVVMHKSVQQMMDEHMCRPGYRWNDTLKRCLAEGGGMRRGWGPRTDPEPGENPASRRSRLEVAAMCV